MFALFARMNAARSLRAFSTKTHVPPNLAAIARNSAAQPTTGVADTVTVAEGLGKENQLKFLVQLYRGLPKGSLKPNQVVTEGMSLKGFLGIIAAISAFSYTITYQFHLKDHKNKEHH